MIVLISIIGCNEIKAENFLITIQNLIKNPSRELNRIQTECELKRIPFMAQKIAAPLGACFGGIIGFAFAPKMIRGIIGGSLLGSLIGIGLSLKYEEVILDKAAAGCAYLGEQLKKLEKYH